MLNVSKKFKDSVYAPVRQINARIFFTLYGVTKEYSDETIISFNLLEEMSTINETLPTNELRVTLDNTGAEFDILTLAKMNEIIASRPEIRLELGLVMEEISDPIFIGFPIEQHSFIEWVPMGIYYLSEWKNETAAMSISLIGQDCFNMLAQISYNNTAASNLYNLAVDVLQKAGITKFSVDDSLKRISSPGFKGRLNSREALQHIGIAGKAAVYQDRTGTVIIKPFTALDASSNYLNYCGQSYYFGGAYPLVTNGFGMKNIEYDQMFEEPEISLDKSIYEVVVKVYESTGEREVVVVNTSIKGTNGDSFAIANPLITTESHARDVANWIITESNYNAIYKTIWRQNPILECADVILVEDSFEAKKQTRIFRQEFSYEGYLNGVTESRGGI
ncbi:hypothetical protein AM500_21355 [Bacillus sp. FJAT-18017]|uniref:hypothetical protein n=1 Tax=Bacillus sp. FJAT-18017 TaxID=1705566 RepID=UPI0006AE1E79|nr:hypothetical protein [Bacillus sp. FJAT-18017]ALC92057.1 hypothetical protein AM500_21355 [Bacillus sp. FJAT-18017]